MKKRTLCSGVSLLGAVDWNRTLFDALIPLPDGTSYNAYLVEGSEKTVLVDTADPSLAHVLWAQLDDVERVDYLVSLHTEQDHSGLLPDLLKRYPGAKVLCSPKAKDLLKDHLHLDDEVLRTMGDGETLALGGKTLTFLHTPWVHWPETMCAYLQEDEILFSCDFFGSHLATSRMFAGRDQAIYLGAKRYYAEIMMPFRSMIRSNMKKLEAYSFRMIAPSHGPVYDEPDFILDAYRDWISDRVANVAVMPYISMHGSTERMADHLLDALVERGVEVQKFDLTVTDIGRLAMSLVDAATLVVGSPAVHVGPHPFVVSAAYLAGVLRPKLRHTAIFGSYGWGNKIAEEIAKLVSGLKAEHLGTVLCKGMPREEQFAALDSLAETIAAKHRAL